MKHKNINLPATLVHKVNGKKYTLNGKLLEINESRQTCTMKFGSQISDNIPLKEVYLNEAALGDIIKKTGRAIKNVASKAWTKIKTIAKSIGGFILPINEDGEALVQFINAPINLGLMDLPSSVHFVPSNRTKSDYRKYGAKLINNESVDEAFEQSIMDEKTEIETYWNRVMREYVQPENESLSINETVKLVNEKYYTNVIDKSLNEAIVSLKSANSDLYGEQVNTVELVDRIISNIQLQLNPIDGAPQKPLWIWGAPGIGKTTIIKQAAKLIKKQYGPNLDFVTVCCGALKPDDFDLPNTVTNVAGQEIAISVPKTWLPVYNDANLTKEEKAKVDAYYNSGKFRTYSRGDIMNDVAKKMGKSSDGKNIMEVSEVSNEYDGGIIFFDEFARLRDIKTADILQTFCGDRTYQEMPLASKWVVITAANRLTDDKKSEADRDFWEIWDDAKLSRFTPLTYVPTKEEWLKWAREENNDGFQNVDEIICRFIEKTGPGVWYDALDFGSREIRDENYQKILHNWGNLDNDELRAANSYITNPSKFAFNLSKTTWNGRTWDQKIAKRIISLLKNELFIKDPEGYNACFSETLRVRELDGGYSTEEYKVKNIDLKKLAEQLNKIDDKVWYRWTYGKMGKIENGDNLRMTDRLGFFMAFIEQIIKEETGADNLPASQWKIYSKVDSVITDADIRSIYENGKLKNPQMVRADNIYFAQRSEYTTNQNIRWKQSPEMVSLVIEKVFKAFDKYITTDDIINDIQSIMYNVDKNNTVVTQKDLDHYAEKYTINLTDETGKRIDSIDTLFTSDGDREPGLDEIIVIILRNSKVSQKIANLVMWVSKIAKQTGSNTPICAISKVGSSDKTIAGGMTGDTIEDKLYALQSKLNAAQSEIYNQYIQNEKYKPYTIQTPAITILNQMFDYSIEI